jgi:hypothetical protein
MKRRQRNAYANGATSGRRRLGFRRPERGLLSFHTVYYAQVANVDLLSGVSFTSTHEVASIASGGMIRRGGP